MKGTPWLVMRIHIQVWWHHLVVWVVDLTYNVKYFNLILLCQSKRLLGHQGNSLCIYMICPCVSAALHADTDTTHSELHTCTTPSKESVKNLNSQKSQPWTAELVMSDMWILSLLLLRLTRMKIWPVWRKSAQVWYSSDQACARHVNLSHHSSYCVINYFCSVRCRCKGAKWRQQIHQCKRWWSQQWDFRGNGKLLHIEFLHMRTCICGVFIVWCRLCDVIEV